MKTLSHKEVAKKMENEFDDITRLFGKYGKIENIMRYVNEETLLKVHESQCENKAIGIDNVTKDKYNYNIEENLAELVRKLKMFRYKPKAVKRVYIPKIGSDKLRPLGIPAYEDKLVQGVMTKILNSIYEPVFKDFSYGFRRDRNAHQAVSELNKIIMRTRVNFIVDADIKGFFDNVNHEWLIKFLENDIKDKNFIRYIKRFLKSGIIKDKRYYKSKKGTPQGGIISPVLANVYLHYVLDLWFEKLGKEVCKGEAYMIRYADDFVCLFQYENEAKQFYTALEERLMRFNLELSKEKSKIIRFGRFAEQNSKDKRTDKFDFLGFTFLNGKTRRNKYRVIVKSSKKKIKSKKENVKKWLKENMHLNVRELIRRINRKIIGHYAYYGVSGNLKALLNFRKFIIISLYKILTRRSQRNYLNMKRYYKLLTKIPIIKPKVYVNIW